MTTNPIAEYVFGHGKVVIEGGLRYGKHAVFIYPAKIGGEVNTSAEIEVRPADAFVEGETVLTFPTEEQADYVMDALYNRARGTGFVTAPPNPVDTPSDPVPSHGVAEEVEAVAVPPAVPEPVYRAVERILDEQSAWIARPNDEVTRQIALAATMAAWAIAEQRSTDLTSLFEDNVRLTAEVEEAVAALGRIAAQQTTKEMRAAFGDGYEADWEGGFDECISVAREAHAALLGKEKS